VSDKRYITITGFAPHHAMDVGIIWIDTASDKSIVATNEYIAHSTDTGKTADYIKFITRGYRSKSEFPKVFLDAYNPFIQSWKSTYADEITITKEVVETR